MTAKPRHTRRFSTLQCLVWAFRCLGLYCFKKPSSAAAADAAAEISLPLLLWAIFVKAYQVTFIVFRVSILMYTEIDDVGTLTRDVYIVASSVSEVLGQGSFLINGNLLWQILSECEEQTCLERRNEASCSGTIPSMEGITTLLFYCSYVPALIFAFINVAYDDSKADVASIAGLGAFHASVVAGSMLSTMFFREVLTILSRKLSVDFLQDASFPGGGGAALSDPHLDTLERVIRKVELLREKIVSFFLTLVSLRMCFETVTVITNMYTFLRLMMDSYPSFKLYNHIVFFMAGSTTLLHLCYSTHHFSQHVHGVASQLRDLRLAVRKEENRAQLQYLILTLERMETFDMGSWYHLGPNTLVSVTTFVVTYLVVLLQVGNQKTQVEPSPTSNTTAG